MAKRSVIVVTGGGQGIGRAIVDQFDHERGWQAAVLDMDQEALDELPGTVWRYTGDVGDPEAVGEFARWLGERTDRVAVLVNNAAVPFRQDMEATTVSEWNRVLSVNLSGAYWMVKSLLPLLRANQGAAVIQIASTRALMSEPHTEAYSAAKGGLLALTHAMAVSLASDQIRVNAISPGWVVSEPWQKSADRHYPELSDADHRQHPSGRVGSPPDIARAVRFLADPANTFINGANLVIDGGMTIKMIYHQD